MSIKVVCGCGFCSLVPSDWAGKRVRCKCGRTFLVGSPEPPAQDTTLSPLPPRAEPTAARESPGEPTPSVAPAAEPPTPSVAPVAEQPTPSVAPAAEPSTPSVAPVAEPLTPSAAPVAEPPTPSAAPVAEPPLSAQPPPGLSRSPAELARPTPVTDTLQRGTHRSRAGPQAMLACITMLLALISLSALLLVLRDNDWSVTAMLGLETRPEGSGSPAGVLEGGDAAPDRSTAGATQGAHTGAGDKGTAASRLASLTELVSDDGLLLSGLFGADTDHLGLSAAQQATIAEVVTRLRENEEALKTKSLSLEQWYAACHKLGDELLAVLTDAQRQQLQVSLQRQEMERVHLVEYAARFVPELAMALMPWAAQMAGRSFHGVVRSSFTAPAQDRCCRPSEPTGILATLAEAGSADAPGRLTTWDLVKDRPGNSVEITSPVTGASSLLSRDGRHLILVRQPDSGPQTVEVWSAEAGKLIDRKELPAARGGRYTVRDCVAHRVVALADRSYWVWDYESGESREIEFPEGRPAAAPCLAVSVDAAHMVVAHPHVIAGEPDDRCLVEVCAYRLNTGELLGNQVFHKDYRRSTIGAIALSPDGQELALLWDFGPDNPARSLVHMSARNGKIIKVVDGLPAADQGYARQHQLLDRELVWLPENSGWVVNLQSVVDAETAAVLPLELPAQVGGGANAAREIVELAPTGDGRLLLIVADRPATPDPKAKMDALFVELPKLGPFQ